MFNPSLLTSSDDVATIPSNAASVNTPFVSEDYWQQNNNDITSMLSIQNLELNNSLLTNRHYADFNNLHLLIKRNSLTSLESSLRTKLLKPDHKTIQYVILAICALFLPIIGNTIGFLINGAINGSHWDFKNFIIDVLSSGIFTGACIVASYIIHKKITYKTHKKILDDEEYKWKLEQEQLILKEKLSFNDVLIQQKMAICSYISHEIRNPLQAILFKAEILKNSHLSSEQLEELNSIILHGKHIEKVADGILKLHKIEAAREQKLVTESFRLSQLANTVIEPLKTIAQSKKIKLSCNANIDFNSEFKGDFKKLTEILTVFMHNAIKFTQSSGTKQSEVKLIIRKEQEISSNIVQLHFTIQDNGVGMGTEQLKRIFQPYPQLEINMKEAVGGIGLGLNMAQILINQINQHCHIDNPIGVTSLLGAGSIFWFRVQLKKNLNMHLRKIARSHDVLESVKSLTTNLSNLELTTKCFSNNNLHILIVEDQQLNQTIMENFLTRLGCTVTIANNGQEAMNIISAADFLYDLIFMDLEMPVMDGFEATAILIKQHKIKIPIVACTGNGTDEDIAKCLSTGMKDVILKPINLNKLHDLLKKFFTCNCCVNANDSGNLSSSNGDLLNRQEITTDSSVCHTSIPVFNNLPLLFTHSYANPSESPSSNDEEEPRCRVKDKSKKSKRRTNPLNIS